MCAFYVYRDPYGVVVIYNVVIQSVWNCQWYYTPDSVANNKEVDEKDKVNWFIGLLI